MRAVLAWLRLDLRRRARSLVALTVLLTLSGTLVIAVTAGARRDGSAMDRLRAVSLPATAVVLPNTVGFDWNEVRALPNVEALGMFPVGTSFGIDGIRSRHIGFATASPDAYLDIERGAVLDGRRFDTSAVDEVVVNDPFTEKYDVGVGDTLTARMFTRKQLAAAADEPEPPDASTAEGPTQRLRIVGVVRVPWTLAFGGEDPGVITSYAFYRRYRADIFPKGPYQYVNALVRLEGGQSDLAQFQTDLAEVTGRNDIEVTDLTAGAKRVTNATSFERNSLLVFALCAAVAALLIVGQAIVRFTASAVTDLEVLRALGLTRRESVLAAVSGPLLAALLAAAASVGGALLASPLFPIGVGATAEPDPGYAADWMVLAPGAVVLVASASLIAYVTAVRSLGHRGVPAAFHRSTVAAWTSRLGLPLPITLGTRLALETGRGRTAVPVRPAMIGAVAGVLGLVAAATFHSGLADAVNTPERYGQTWQAVGFLGINGKDFGAPDEIAAQLTDLADRPEVVGVNDTRLVPASIERHSLTVFELAPLGDGVPPVSVSGRAPESYGEVALAPLTAEQLDVQPGDSVKVVGEKSMTMRVSGITFVPAAIHNSYDEGAWVTADALSRLYPSGFFKFHLFLVRLAAGTDADAAMTAIEADTKLELDSDSVPPDVVNLTNVSHLPTLMSVFLALLAVGAVGHALATAVYRRRHDMAVLRALGMTHPQIRAIVAWQATTLALVGLVFGAPLGLALARTLWRVVAERTPVQYVPPLALLALVLVVPLSVVVANLLAAYPGHQAVRQRISTVLRAE